MITDAASLLRRARELAGLSQRELAERAGTSQPAVARLESGSGSVTVPTLARLLAAAGFELSMDLVPQRPDDAVAAAYRRDVDRSLLRQNLRRSVDDRLRSGAELATSGSELRDATKVAIARTRRGK